MGTSRTCCRGAAVRVDPVFRRGRAFAIAVAVTAGAAVSTESPPAWTLEQHGRTYTYTLTLSSTLPQTVLLDILFDPRHVAAFSTSAGRLVVLKEDGLVNEVRFETRRLIFTCTSTFRRTLVRESGSIEIELTGFKAGWGRLAPQAQSSRARYTVTDLGTHREIVYRQDVDTDRPVSGYSLRVLRKSMGEFARDLNAYLRRSDLATGAGESSRPVK